MICYGLWYGGSSYAAPNQFNREDIDKFGSLQSAKSVFESRADHDPFRPCVENDETEMQIFFSDPFEIPDIYPDRIIKFGPRGGTIIERC